VANGFRGRFFDLGLHLRLRRSFVDEDSVLTLLDEETARASVAILLEGHGLDRQVEDVSADNDANEAEQTAAIDE